MNKWAEKINVKIVKANEKLKLFNQNPKTMIA